MSTNAIDSLMRSVGQIVWELQITGETAGDTPLDVPVPVTKKHRVYGVWRLATAELLEQIGTSTQADAIFVSRETITMTSQLEFEDVKYEITERVDARPHHAGNMYAYICHRYPRRSQIA